MNLSTWQFFLNGCHNGILRDLYGLAGVEDVTTRNQGELWRIHILGTPEGIRSAQYLLQQATITVEREEYEQGRHGRMHRVGEQEGIELRSVLDVPPRRPVPCLREPYEPRYPLAPRRQYTLCLVRCGLLGGIALCGHCGEWADLAGGGELATRDGTLTPETTYAVCIGCVPDVDIVERRPVFTT